MSTVILSGECPAHGFEYQSYIAPYSSQYGREENAVIVGDLQTERARGAVAQVSGADFYEEGHPGYRYVLWAEQYEMEDYLFLTTGTNSLNLLPSWHEEKAKVVAGRKISAEEFAAGATVCMVPDMLAGPNQLEVGDKISLPLLCVCYKDMGSSLGRVPYDFSLLNAEGELYELFWEQAYEIVGIYNAGGDFTHDMVDDMLIIPAKSVQASDNENIACYEPMSKNTVSFQIPNGSIAEFDTALKCVVKETENLAISYDDRGYAEIIQSLEASRSIAFLLLAAGVLAALAIIALLLYFFVVKERKRTAIERSLGMSKRQCRVSLLAGLLVLTIAATGIGSIGGVLALDQVQGAEAKGETVEQANSRFTYDTRYSMWAEGRELAENVEIEVAAPVAVYFAVPLGVFLLVLVLSQVLLYRSFQIDPIHLLSTKDKG
ncbi:ABC transporter permease [Acutalibacter caecimuris]|uniref:ABC transporter permease n=1 Tax=Acutalibacter caecimuris TaxID=3093657 RepID=UPI002AC99F95|nr:FtsX-like permease family protein [Acutalibacter sp. M00118]